MPLSATTFHPTSTLAEHLHCCWVGCCCLLAFESECIPLRKSPLVTKQIMPTTLELNTEYQSAERFPAWMALSVFSAICLAGTTSQRGGDRDAADKWVLAATSMSMILGFFAVLAYLFVRHLFVAQIPELIWVRASCIHPGVLVELCIETKAKPD